MEDYQVFFASITAIIAASAVAENIVNYRLASNKRRDDLFDRRYKFYKSFEKDWKSTGSERDGATKMMMEWDDILAWELEASFLFGEDIAKHIRSYEGKSFSGLQGVPDTELAKPFKKYLRLS